MKSIIISIIFLCTVANAPLWGQAQIFGQLQDENQEPLAGANIVLLQAQDSALMHFALSNADGKYRIDRVKTGQYLLRISYLGYGELELPLDIKEDTKDIDMGTIPLQPESALLSQVEVKAERLPVVINGDTISYDAAFFNVQPDADVETLLKKLPGIEVDGEGNIKAQGEDVERVLVDGKEFFGNDPKVATRNIPADAIDRVEVFDRESEAEMFTGLDDGVRNTTINLELKPDRRNGLFGKASAGYGTQDRYVADANAFKFGEDRQLAFIGMANNINRTGFSLMDFFNFGGGMGAGGGQIQIGGSGSDALPIGDERAQGFYRTAAAGLNFSRDWGKKMEFRSSYFYWQNRSDLRNDITRIFPTLEPILTNDIRESSINRLQNHRLELNLRLRPDTLQRFSLQSQLYYQDRRDSRTSEFRRLLGEDQQLNSLADQVFGNEQSYLAGIANISYQRKLGQADRVLSLNVDWQRNTPRQEAIQSLDETQWVDQTPIQIDSLEQRQDYEANPTNWRLGLGISEAWGPYWLGRIGYDLRIEQENQRRTFLDINNGGEVINTDLSSDFDLSYWNHIPRVGLQWKKDKQRWELGLAWQLSQNRLQQFGVTTSERWFNYALPRLRYRYQGSNFSALDLQYQANVQLPNGRQLANIPDNSNPNRLYTGNPGLQPEYQHQVRASFNRFDMFSGVSFLLFNTTTYTQDQISTAQSIDELSRQQVQPINIEDAWQNTSYLSFSHPLRFLKLNAQWELTGNWLASEVRLNEVDNPFNQLYFSGGLRIDNKNKDVVDWALGYRLIYSNTRYLEGEIPNRSFSQQNYSFDLNLNLGSRRRMSSNWTVQTFQNEDFADQAAIPIGQFSMSYYIDRKQRTQLEFQVFDILDRNRGIDRLSQANYLEERLTQSLGRYFLLKVGHRFRVI